MTDDKQQTTNAHLDIILLDDINDLIPIKKIQFLNEIKPYYYTILIFILFPYNTAFIAFRIS